MYRIRFKYVFYQKDKMDKKGFRQDADDMDRHWGLK